MIKNYLRYSLSEPEKGKINSFERHKSITLKYPCENSSICTPYELLLNPAVYKFECWGSKGSAWTNYNPGFGGYTKGTLLITKPTKMYVFIGAQGSYNSIKGEIKVGVSGGRATDVRLNKTDNWYDKESLISRIMVAAGGGGAEWYDPIGGNGGGLNGGTSFSPLEYFSDTELFDNQCEGATQTSGTSCPDISTHHAFPGSFGFAGYFQSNDHGGMGGGGYYGGTSYDYAYAGSGGSSFISGHKGCNAVNDSIDIVHTNTPFHYSGFVFSDTEMIPGNETMPLPFSSDKGKWNDSGGAFRVTLVGYRLQTCNTKYFNYKTNTMMFK